MVSLVRMWTRTREHNIQFTCQYFFELEHRTNYFIDQCCWFCLKSFQPTSVSLCVCLQNIFFLHSFCRHRKAFLLVYSNYVVFFYSFIPIHTLTHTQSEAFIQYKLFCHSFILFTCKYKSEKWDYLCETKCNFIIVLTGSRKMH